MPLDDAAPAVPEARGTHVRIVAILGALAAFGPLAVDTYLPALPEISRDLGASTSVTQLTLTACLCGLAAGQLVGGPVSDALGRRRPILAGVAGFTALSVLCALAPTVWALVTFRFLQGLGGGVGIVIARAVVRDRHVGVAAVRVFSLMMVVTGVAPIVAPLLGALLLQVTSWRAIFAFLGIAGALILAATAIGLPESLPHDRRRGSGLRATLTVFRGLATDRWFVGCTLACALPFGAMFAYIAGSPFVLQELYGLSPAAFGAVFGVNAVGLVCTALLGNRLVGHFGSLRLLLLALLAGCVGGAGLLVSVVAGVGLWGVLPSLFVVVSVIGIVLPNATALALADHPDVAGSASALLGVLTFLIGAAVAPLVGVAGADDALPLALVVAVLEVAALAQLLVLTRSAAST